MSIFHYVDRNDDEKRLHSSLNLAGPNQFEAIFLGIKGLNLHSFNSLDT